MKKVILAVVLLLGVVSLPAFAGFFSDFIENGKRVENPGQPIEVIVEVTGKTQSQLYSTAKSWIGESRIMEITDADKDSGRIVGKGEVGNSQQSNSFSLRIDTKDGKIRLTFSDFFFRDQGIPPSGIVSKGDLKRANNIANILSQKLRVYATQQAVSDKW
jgi:hypothetical protein